MGINPDISLPVLIIEHIFHLSQHVQQMNSGITLGTREICISQMKLNHKDFGEGNMSQCKGDHFYINLQW